LSQFAFRKNTLSIFQYNFICGQHFFKHSLIRQTRCIDEMFKTYRAREKNWDYDIFWWFLIKKCEIRDIRDILSDADWNRTRDLSLNRQNRTAVTFITYKFEACTMNHHGSAERFYCLAKVLFERKNLNFQIPLIF